MNDFNLSTNKDLNLSSYFMNTTAGLTSYLQLINTTASEIVNFNNNTDLLEDLQIILPFNNTLNNESYENDLDIIKKFESLIENKFKKSVDIKEIYYNQFENNLL